MRRDIPGIDAPSESVRPGSRFAEIEGAERDDVALGSRGDDTLVGDMIAGQGRRRGRSVVEESLLDEADPLVSTTAELRSAVDTGLSTSRFTAGDAQAEEAADGDYRKYVAVFRAPLSNLLDKATHDVIAGKFRGTVEAYRDDVKAHQGNGDWRLIRWGMKVVPVLHVHKAAEKVNGRTKIVKKGRRVSTFMLVLEYRDVLNQEPLRYKAGVLDTSGGDGASASQLAEMMRFLVGKDWQDKLKAPIPGVVDQLPAARMADANAAEIATLHGEISELKAMLTQALQGGAVATSLSPDTAPPEALVSSTDADLTPRGPVPGLDDEPAPKGRRPRRGPGKK